jgi:hypothetical protein
MTGRVLPSSQPSRYSRGLLPPVESLGPARSLFRFYSRKRLPVAAEPDRNMLSSGPLTCFGKRKFKGGITKLRWAGHGAKRIAGTPSVVFDNQKITGRWSISFLTVTGPRHEESFNLSASSFGIGKVADQQPAISCGSRSFDRVTYLPAKIVP